jgi:hypothetical protein
LLGGGCSAAAQKNGGDESGDQREREGAVQGKTLKVLQ